MAKFRMVYTEFWTDSKVVEEFTPEDKYFFLYLLTNPNTTQIGIYEITKKQMAFDMGYSLESVDSLLDRFINHHKLIKYNPETRELAIRNWGKFNLNQGGKPVLDCIRAELGRVKDTSLIDYVAEQITNDTIKHIYDTWHESSTDRITIRGEKEEKEEEKEEEKQQEEEEQKELPPTPYEKIKTLYNTFCLSLPQVRAMSEKRKRHLRARWRQFACDLTAFEEVFRKVEASEFCKGKNDRGWRADFDWLIKNDHNMVKVLEGKYDNREVETGGADRKRPWEGWEDDPFYIDLTAGDGNTSGSATGGSFN